MRVMKLWLNVCRGGSRLNEVKGAVLVEFAIAAIVFFMLVLVFFQVGITMHRYQLLAHIVNSVTRELAVDVGGIAMGDLQNLVEKARNEGEVYLEQYLGEGAAGDEEELGFNASVFRIDGVNGNRCVLRLTGALPVHLFNTKYLPIYTISVASETYIEDKLYPCVVGNWSI